MSDNDLSRDNDLFKKGAEQMAEIYQNIIPAGEPGTSRFMDMMVPQLFGTLWDDDKLSIRDRRLFTMGIIAAMGEYDVFQIQAMAALKRKELSEDELRELCCQAAPYAGYPRSGGLLSAVAKAIDTVKDTAK